MDKRLDTLAIIAIIADHRTLLHINGAEPTTEDRLGRQLPTMYPVQSTLQLLSNISIVTPVSHSKPQNSTLGSGSRIVTGGCETNILRQLASGRS